ncbi:group II intron reverse transcriptase/maturase [Bacillus sp. BRMEA1]|uniref:group II intron reverse transcriptase/maturase n=1 Tax=Neobacillus endophyticus TaxID=2738405 RepID=UPI0015674B1F|nr:group II intron reverse transcriptase/maturase [Neobacillus endophyticus]NRD80884.1 group II intron reverse transcriptase/maturase [Neobacillus endophyticus]
MYEESKLGKSFNGLYELIRNEHTIVTAIHDIKSNKGSWTAGVDKKTINHFLQMPVEKLLITVTRAMDNYSPKAVRRRYIPKGNTGKTRPLGIPTMLDRIIQQCVKIVIEPIIEAKMYEHSYGFRPYRSTHHAISRCASLINKGRYQYVIEGDIKGYFDNINHSILLRKLHNIGIIDKRVLMLIRKMLKAGLMEDFKFYETNEGTPQGGIISPILANVYLNDFDWMVSSMYENPYFANDFATVKNARRKFRQLGRQPVFLVRYADDWVIFCKDREYAGKVLKHLQKYFKHKLKLELSEEKTVITNLQGSRMKFLGFEIEMGKPRFDIGRTGNKKQHDTYARILPNTIKVRSKVAEILLDIKKLKVTKDDYQKAVIIERANSKIIGLAEYYKIAVWTEIFNRLDHKIFQSCHYTWKKFTRNKNNGKDKTRALISFDKLSNRPARHEKYKAETHAIEIEGKWIGMCRFLHTPSVNPKNFNQEMTPYTPKGRELYQTESKKRLPLARQPLYDYDSFRMAKANAKSKNPKKRKYNFEYYMNREYAWNRDKGKCKICDVDILITDLHTHHVDPNLPLDRINKLPNLASVHRRCHELIHGIKWHTNSKINKKIERYRAKLVKRANVKH